MFKFVIIYLFCSSVYSEQNKCLNPLADYLKNSNGFILSFTQINSYSFSKEKKEAKGSLITGTNGKFIWELKGEYGGSVISNGKKIWFYTPPEDEEDQGSLIIKNAKEQQGITSILLDCSRDSLISSINKNGLIKSSFKGSEKKGYKWAEIAYHSKPFVLLNLSFEDTSGNKTSIISNSFIKLKKPVSNSFFNFKIPKDTKILN